MFHNLAGMGGRRWAGLGALAGGALGAMMPGKDEDGESRGALSGALRGAVAGGLAGGLGGMAAKRFMGPKGPMGTMQQANQGAQQLAADQAQHGVSMARAQSGLSRGLDKHIYDPGAFEAARAQGKGYLGALWSKFNPFGGAQRVQNKVDVSRAREVQQLGAAQTHEKALAGMQAQHQQAMQQLDPAAAATATATTKAQANAEAVHRAHGAHMNSLYPGGVDHRRLTPDALQAKVKGLVDAGHLKGNDAILAGHVPPAVPPTPTAPMAAPTQRDAAADLYTKTIGGTPHAGYTHDQLNRGLAAWAADPKNASHPEFAGVQQHLLLVGSGGGGGNPQPNQPNQPNPRPGGHPRYQQFEREAQRQGVGYQIQSHDWGMLSPNQQAAILRIGRWQNRGGDMVRTASTICPVDVFSPKLAARRPFSAPKQTVAERVQGAFAPRKTKADTAPVAAEAAEQPKATPAAKPKEAPEAPSDDKKVAASPAVAATMPPGAGPATAVAPLKTSEVAVPVAAVVEPAKAAEVAPAAVAEPAIKVVKLAALAA